MIKICLKNCNGLSLFPIFRQTHLILLNDPIILCSYKLIGFMSALNNNIHTYIYILYTVPKNTIGLYHIGHIGYNSRFNVPIEIICFVKSNPFLQILLGYSSPCWYHIGLNSSCACDKFSTLVIILHV